MGFRSIMAGLASLGHPREQASKPAERPHGPGLWPTDARGQYVSAKATSKRRRGA